MNKFDWKSAVIGGMLVMIVSLLMGAGNFDEWLYCKYLDRDSPHGRFQIAACDSMAYIVDTALGRVWSESHIETQHFDPNSEFRSIKINFPSDYYDPNYPCPCDE